MYVQRLYPVNVQPYRQIFRVRFIVAGRLYEIDVLFRLSYIKKKYMPVPMALVFRRIDGIALPPRAKSMRRNLLAVDYGIW